MRHEHGKEISGLRKKHSDMERTLRADAQGSLSVADDKLARAIAEHSSRIENLRTESTEATDRLTANAAARERDSLAAHERETRELQVRMRAAFIAYPPTCAPW
jgi:hypothetical protein